MTHCRTVLVAPPLVWNGSLRLSFQPPLNLIYLASALRADGWDAQVLDVVALRCDLDETVERVVELQPSVVGIPLYAASLASAFELARRLAERCPDLLLVAGGPSLTMQPEQMMQASRFDCGVIGEGEQTLLELVAARANGDPLMQVRGLIVRNDAGALRTPPREPIQDLDALPFLDYSTVDTHAYLRAQASDRIPQTVFLSSSRGCACRCAYCCTPVLWPGRTRRFSPARLVAEIRHQLEHHPGVAIGFCDDSFFFDRKWLVEFIDRVEPLQIDYHCIGRVDHLDPALIARLARSGLRHVSFGVETGSAQRQKALRKHLKLDTVEQTVRELAANGVETKCFFMLGFPDETPDEMLETINLAVRLRRAGMSRFTFFPVTIYPGTELARQFPDQPGHGGLDAHLPELIRDNLEVGIHRDELLARPYNGSLNHQQLVDLVRLAHDAVNAGEPMLRGDVLHVLSQDVAAFTESPTAQSETLIVVPNGLTDHRE